MAQATVHYRTCPFCEATCGLEVTIEGDDVVSVRGDPDDVFSRGFLCPKSQGLKQLHDDPDRLTRPLIRRDGELREASWEEAFPAVDQGLSRVLAEGGRDAVAVYLGNPSAHSLGAMVYGQAFLKALRSNNSWMHNLPALVKGKDRCTVQIHPADAERLGLTADRPARVSSSVGELVAPVEITDEIMPGVVSIPHGWGHDVAGVRMGVAAAHAGVNSNLLAPIDVDVPSGNAVLNGIPVEVTAADRESTPVAV